MVELHAFEKASKDSRAAYLLEGDRILLKCIVLPIAVFQAHDVFCFLWGELGSSVVNVMLKAHFLVIVGLQSKQGERRRFDQMRSHEKDHTMRLTFLTRASPTFRVQCCIGGRPPHVACVSQLHSRSKRIVFFVQV